MSNFLRSFRGGLLKVQLTPDRRPFLLNAKKPSSVCNIVSDTDVCYSAGKEIDIVKSILSSRKCYSNFLALILTGDGRVNQNTEIAVSQVMFVRLHNLLANELSVLNPDWNDHTLFHETRKIVVAVLQHITYNEYLPLLLGMYEMIFI